MRRLPLELLLHHPSRNLSRFSPLLFPLQFYMGEVAPQDRELVPGPDEPPSAEFLQQVSRSRSGCRCKMRVQVQACLKPAHRFCCCCVPLDWSRCPSCCAAHMLSYRASLPQLREFTPWRLQVEEEAVATHLGAKRAAAAH